MRRNCLLMNVRRYIIESLGFPLQSFRLCFIGVVSALGQIQIGAIMRQIGINMKGFPSV